MTEEEKEEPKPALIKPTSEEFKRFGGVFECVIEIKMGEFSRDVHFTNAQRFLSDPAVRAAAMKQLEQELTRIITAGLGIHRKGTA